MDKGKRFRPRLGYANVVSTLALVFAMSGGALAAQSYLIRSIRQISPRVLKALHGARGTQGPQGTHGLQGTPGTNGTDGKAGSNGVSVTSESLAAGDSNCPSGGASFSSANGLTFACNGAPGSAIAYATVAVNGDVDSASGITQSEMVHAPGSGVYCIYGLPSEPVNVQVTLEGNDSFPEVATAFLGFDGACSNASDNGFAVLVSTPDGTPEQGTFMVAVIA